MRRLLPAAFVTGLALFAFAGAAMAGGSGGVTGPAFYVDGQLYRTVNTPTDLSNTGAPDSSFDTIYQFFGLQPNVATRRVRKFRRLSRSGFICREIEATSPAY